MSDGIETKKLAFRKKMIKRVIKSHAAGELDDVYEYFQDLERKFDGDKRRIFKRYDEEAKTIESDPDLKYELDEYFSDEFHMIENIYLKTFRYSVIVAIYSIVEVSLNDLCRYLCNHNKLALTLDELRDDGILRAKNYLSKVCNVDFPSNSHEWHEVVKLNTIRNCIIHAQGNADKVKSPKKIKSIVDNTSGVGLKTERYLIIEKSYVESTLGNVKKLLDMIYDKAFEVV